MSKRAKQKRNSPFRQRAINPLGALSFLTNATMNKELLAGDQVIDLSLGNWIAFNNMVSGASSEYDWNIVTGALNIAMVLAERGLGEEHTDLFIRALDGTFRAKLRGERLGIWRFDGEALTTVRTALELHDQQCQLSTRLEVVKALHTVRRRIDSGHIYQAQSMAA